RREALFNPLDSAPLLQSPHPSLGFHVNHSQNVGTEEEGKDRINRIFQDWQSTGLAVKTMIRDRPIQKNPVNPV
ncbi:MAG TPA: hypothetical protein VKS99_07445, partial [Blastocatellia bacterium]|nr:hypothetical protein [Blastocatellia bacterium]